MKFLYVFLIVLTATGCNYFDLKKQKKWESISIKEKRALYDNVNKSKSTYKLEDFINEFGTPIDSLDYKSKFTNDIIEYSGLLAPNVKSMNQYEKYVKQILFVLNYTYIFARIQLVRVYFLAGFLSLTKRR